jgi:hypothetical protein
MAENEAAAARKDSGKTKLFRWLIYLQLLGLFAFAYVRMGGLLITQTNHTTKQILGGDQKHNLRLALQTREDLNPDFSKGFMKALTDFFPHRTDGVVQPLWPWVAAWFADPSHPTPGEADAQTVTEQDVDFFNQGRWFHVFMTATFLVVLGIAAGRLFSIPAALNLVLLGGFGALLPRAAYFQPEPLYFVFFFLTWVACISALTHNSLWIYGLIGVLSGIAYMAKGSISPLIMVFVGISSLRCAWELISARRRGYILANGNLWHWRNHFMGLIILGMAHLLTIGPRLTDANEKFGDPFHSYPSYWMWMDQFSPDCYEWMAEHNTKEKLQALLPADKPSLGKYLRTHGTDTFVTRLKDGTWNRTSEFFWPKQTKRSKKIENQKPWKTLLEWRGVYLLFLGGMLGGLMIVLRSAAPKAEHAGHVVFRHGTATIVLFVLGSLAIYSLAYGFYAPIARGSGDRFMLSLYLPLVFSLIWGCESVIRRLRRRQGCSPWIARGYLAAQWLLLAAITWRLVEIFRFPFFDNR